MTNARTGKHKNCETIGRSFKESHLFHEFLGSLAISWFLILAFVTILDATTNRGYFAFETMSTQTGIAIAAIVLITGILRFAICRTRRKSRKEAYHHDTATAQAVSAMNFFLTVVLTCNGRRSTGVSVGLLLIAVFGLALLRNRSSDAKSLKIARYTSGFVILFAIFWILAGFVTKDFSALKPDDIRLMIMITVAVIVSVIAGSFLFNKMRIFDPHYIASGMNSSRRLWLIVLAVAALAHLVIIGIYMLYRIYAMVTPTYDFGLFAQMFHYLKEHGTLETTLERSRQMSHLHVHFSPILYLLWPLYKLFPSPYTIQTAQLVIAASAVIPTYLIAKQLKLNGFWRAAVGLMMLIHPALMGSSLYDFHENCFLAPLVLWVLYFMLAEKRLGYYIAVILLLTVKEDAVLYVMCIALYDLTRPTKKRHALAIMVLGAVYFIGASHYLTQYGTGVMTYRFDNIQGFEDLGFFGYVLTVLAIPVHVIGQVFTAGKIIYLMVMLLPFGMLPLLGKRVSRVLLFVPLFVMNLVSDWQYQYDIEFQYHYATLAFLAFLTLLALSEISEEYKTKSSVEIHEPSGTTTRFESCFATTRILPISTVLAFVSGIVLLTTVMAPRFNAVAYYRSRRAETRELKAVLDTRIPAGASLRTSPFLSTYLSQRDYIFDIEYEHLENADNRKTDFIVLDDRHGRTEKSKEYISDALQNGYIIDYYQKGLVMILKPEDGVKR